ncbi:divalent-cation tolerance protein CutA [Thermosulfurimonas marina]|uniref:Divalent-cation tolerance protein CutA n=1 Tax=Thermosulfurimonas marina TaxID=2047767 RepID=A0A6H1WSL1_9BACT|nr:divalent-cation tolerance protein CutA [Thermosulfurimonas marina]QJA06116.1 divalent-cation tolerance protein CutA [Thermosulfurimonas marina]
MREVMLLYVTASGPEEAKRLGRHLVERRLAACVNIFPEMHSFYWWEGKLESSREAVLLVKTRKELAEAAREEIVRLHSYSCPCILEIPVAGGHPPFLEWIYAETPSR